MVFLKIKKGACVDFKKFLISVKVKYNCFFLYFFGKYNIQPISLYPEFVNKEKFKLDFLKIQQNLRNAWLIVNNGFMGQLYLNGLGFKSTRKESDGKRYWRFNVGHSHVFKFCPPKEITVKVKARVLFFFCINHVQVGDTLHKLRSFHVPDKYKGVGIKFKDEFIRLKKGKTRQ